MPSPLRLALLALLIVGGACKRDEGAREEERRPRKSRSKKSASVSLLERYPIRPHVRWKEKGEEDGKPVERRAEEIWTPIEEDDAGPRTLRAWKVVQRDLDGTDPSTESRYELREEGLVYVSMTIEGTVIPIDPPKIALPANPTPGDERGGKHTQGTKTNERRCRIAAWSECDDGIEDRCTTTYPDGRVIEVTNRFCGGVGWVGYSARFTSASGKISRWSSVGSAEDVK